MSKLAPDNPFSTRFIRPGALPFCYPQDASAEQLIARLRQHCWQAEITGRHGVGKTSLLKALLPMLEREGRQVIWIGLHDGQRRLPSESIVEPLQPETLVVVDGYEQLARLARWSLRRACRRAGCGLVVTAHRPTGLPCLIHLDATIVTVRQLVEQLVPDKQSRPSEAEVVQAFKRHAGNVRATLFDLYDRYEERRCRS